ncbi:acetyltransferase [Robertmurraya korlensis]|uniref:acetyltransferase n=1 Tax=Robertmurraya korlensis TaxID=519977 RepID=UPI000825F451|nr:acetyltransferase [Robertmurraya korlensis]
MQSRILLIGGGGHCKSVIDSIIRTKHYSDIGIIDREERIGKSILSFPIIGCDGDLLKLYESGYRDAFVTVGSIGDSTVRKKLFQLLETIGFALPNIIDDSAIVSKYATLEKGIFIGKNVVVNAGSFIYKGAILNTSSVVEHDSVVQEFSHIAPGVVLCGDVKIGANTHIGAKSVVKQNIHIGSNSIIGMGSVVISDIEDNVVAYGNPCKEVRPK